MYFLSSPLFLVLEVVWVAHVLRRLRGDVEEWRGAKEPAARVGIAIVWGITVVIVYRLTVFVGSFVGLGAG